MSFFEFPHTRTYDSDLGFIIKWIKDTQPGLDNIDQWIADHQHEYEILADKVDGLINSLVEVIVPWDSSIAYHIYSIVEYQGTNYIAVKDVPVGTMITNEEYWMPANTVIEQINAIGLSVDHLTDNIGITSPEEYGAAGDGIVNDTAAWQAAIDSGKKVVAKLGSTYRVSTLNLLDNNSVDCSGASFICQDSVLFNITGSVGTVYYHQPDYSAETPSYTFDAVNYDGYAILEGSNNWEPTRTYYRGGWRSLFNKGVMAESCPVDITDPTITLIDPVSVDIKNIGNVTFLNTHDGIVIDCYYGVNCIFDHINMTNECFSVIRLSQCLNITMTNIKAAIPQYMGTLNNIYPIEILNSNHCYLHDSYIYCNFWHCWSAGGTYPCFDNGIINSTLISDLQVAVGDHPNCIGTFITDSTINSALVAGGSRIKGVNVIARNQTGAKCSIRLYPNPIKELAIYNIQDVNFYPALISNEVGVTFAAVPQVTGTTAYYDNVTISNCKVLSNTNNTGADRILLMSGGLTGFGTIKLGTINISDVNLRVQLQKATNIDMTGAILNVTNCNNIRYTQDRYIEVDQPEGGELIISNSHLYRIMANNQGAITHMSNVVFDATLVINADEMYGNTIYMNAGTINAENAKRLFLTNFVIQKGTSAAQRMYSRIWKNTAESSATRAAYVTDADAETIITL